MNIPDGIYRIYKVRFDERGEKHRLIAARLHFENGQVEHLENHHDLDTLFPEGPVTPAMVRTFMRFKTNPYTEVIHEADIHEGHHDSEVQELDIGTAEPEHRFTLTGPSIPHPQIVEMWDDVVVLDGRELDDSEAHQLLGEVKAGRLHLVPMD